MNTEQSLKKQNRPYLWTYFVFNALLFLGLFFAYHFETITHNYKAMFTIRNSGILLSPIILFILNGLLSSSQKAILVFWRIKNPLPGSKAFTHHALKDSRIDLSVLANLYNPLPTSPEGQNSLWYKIYRKHIADTVIVKSHKDFLLGRDLVSMTFLFIILVGVPMLLIGKLHLSAFYFIFLLLEYLILVRVAQNHGKRFVCNALAIESTT